MKFFIMHRFWIILPLFLVLPTAQSQETHNVPLPVEPAASNASVNPAVACYPVLQTYSAWVKPGNSLIPKMVHIKEGSERLDFDTGKSAFAAVRFADIKLGQKIQVMLVRDLNLTKLSTVLLPSYVLLDQNFCEISAKTKLIFVRKKWVSALSNAAETADIVVAPNQQPTYVLLYSDAGLNGQEILYKDEYGLRLATTIRTEYGYLNLQAVKSK